jgi:GNAT superfamily N-acetyltransferase
MDHDTVIREMALPDVFAAQELLQRAFGEAVRQRTGRLAGPPFGPRLATVRFQKEPPGAFIALRGGRVVGCVFSVRWGSLAYFGPIAVAPESQGLGIAQRLIEVVHQRWRRARVRLWGLECIGEAAQLVHLYTKMGYAPLSVGVAFIADATAEALPRGFSIDRFGELPLDEREAALKHVKRIGSEAVPGLDPSVEVSAALENEIGDTLLVHDRKGIVGFAVAHWTPLLRADGLAVPIAAVSRRGGTRATGALLRGLRTLALERQLAHVWIRVAGRRVKAQEVLRREGFRADQSRLRMKRGRDEERATQLLFDSWL